MPAFPLALALIGLLIIIGIATTYLLFPRSKPPVP